MRREYLFIIVELIQVDFPSGSCADISVSFSAPLSPNSKRTTQTNR